MEQHLGVQLLHRTTRRLHLTEAGEVFARYAQRIVEEAREADLRKHNCLVYSQSPKSAIWIFKDKNGEDINIKVKGNLRTDDGKLLLCAALAGQGLLIGPSFMVANAIKEGQLKPALGDYSRTAMGLYAVYPYSKLVSPLLRQKRKIR